MAMAGRHSGTRTRPGSTRSSPSAHLRIVARRGLLRHQLVQANGHARHVAVADVRGRVADHHVAARRQRADQLADELIRLLVVLDQVQDRGQDDRDRAAEVKRPGRLGQDRERLAQIGLDKVGSALGGADQQRASMAQHDRVVVDVDDPACDATDWATSWMLLLAGMPVPMSRN